MTWVDRVLTSRLDWQTVQQAASDDTYITLSRVRIYTQVTTRLA